MPGCGASGKVDAPGDKLSRSTGLPPRQPALSTAAGIALATAESTYRRTEIDSARALFRSALAAADAEGDSVLRARALTWLGLTDSKQANYASAKSWGEQALALKQRLHLTRELPRSYNALGLIAYYQGRYDDALALLTSALDTARAVNDSVGITKAVANLGMVWTDLGDYARARTAYEQARDFMFATGDKRSGANALSNMGMLEIRVGNPTGAVQVLTVARAVFDTLDDAPGQESSLGQLAEAFAATGDPRLAFAYTDSALAVARRYGLRQQEVDGLRHKAALYFDAGDLQRSLSYFEQARSLATELGLQEVLAEIARGEASVLSAVGEIGRAEASANEALALHAAVGTPLEHLADRLLVAELAQRAGHRAQSAAALRAADRDAKAFPVASARVLVALTKARIADAQGEPQRSLAALAPVDSDLARVGPSFVAEAFAVRARSLARLGRLSAAADAGRQSVAALELVRQRFGTSALGTTFTASRAGIYGDLVLVLARLGRVNEALQIADAARGRSLLEHLDAARTSGVPNVGRDALIRGEHLLTRIDALVGHLANADSAAHAERGSTGPGTAPSAMLAELVAARREYEELLMRAAESDPRSTALLGAGRASAEDVRRVVAPDEAVMEYLDTPERLVTFVVRREGITVLDTAATPDAIAARVRLARDMIGRKADGPPAPVLGALHELLIAPAERRGLLRGVRTLIVVPHGALTYLPFSALRDTVAGQFLVERYDFVTLPSANALAALRREPSQSPATAPNATGATVLAPFTETLPGTRDEAREVGRVLGHHPLVGLDAHERALRRALERSAVVHVASHAVLNGQSPMFSRLELSRGSGASDDDGRFELHELLATRVGSRLVFLSGCETALGTAWSTTFLRGEDYATIAQAFLQAGASNVVATLWRIEDRGAAAFASSFYESLRDRPPAAALALAQRAMLRSRGYSAPYYWAAYQIEGAGDAANIVRKLP